MKKSIIGLALLAAMGAGSVNAQSGEGWSFDPATQTVNITGKVKIDSSDKLYEILGYSEEKGETIYNERITPKNKPVRLYWGKLNLRREDNISEQVIREKVEAKNISKSEKLESAYLSSDDVDRVVLDGTNGEAPSVAGYVPVPSSNKAYHLNIQSTGCLEITDLQSEKRTITITNWGQFKRVSSLKPGVTWNGEWWDFIPYLIRLLDYYLGDGWKSDIQVLYTTDEKNENYQLIDYNIPSQGNSNLSYFKYEEGDGTSIEKEFEVGNIVSIKDLTLESITWYAKDGSPLKTQSGQFYNKNYQKLPEISNDQDFIKISVADRLYEAMSRLRIGDTYYNNDGILVNENEAPAIFFKKTYMNAEGLVFYPLAVPFFTDSKKNVVLDGKESMYNQEGGYIVGLYSGYYRANYEDSPYGSWKEVTDDLDDYNEHEISFRAGYTGSTQMPQYRAHQILFQATGNHTIVFRNQATLKDNTGMFTKGLIPYYMADGGTYILENVGSPTNPNFRGTYAQFAVWKQPLYDDGDDVNDSNDNWHFFANPLPYNVRINNAADAYFYDFGQDNTSFLLSCADVTDFNGYAFTREGNLYKYDQDSYTGGETVFQVGEPFFAKARLVILPVANENAFVESEYASDDTFVPTSEAIFTYTAAIDAPIQTRAQPIKENTVTTIQLQEKATGYSNRTFIKTDKNALENQSEFDAFGMISAGTVNIWTSRDKEVLAKYGYNPDITTTIPVAMSTHNAGEHIITAENIPSGVELWLYKAGKPVCCLNESAYTFNAPKSSNIDDFTLVTRGTDPTANEEISANEQNIRAYMVGSTCRIEGLEAGMTYNVYAINGATVANGTAHANVADVALPTPGVYVVKVVSTNNEEQVIKIKY